MANSAVESLKIADITDILKDVQSMAWLDKAAWNAVGEQLTIIHKERYQQEIAPDGTPWAPLSEKYAAKKAEDAVYDKLLQYSGKLYDTLHHQADDYGVKFGSNEVHAATHHYGRKEDGIPARPFIGLNEDDKKIIAEEVTDAYLQWLKANS